MTMKPKIRTQHWLFKFWFMKRFISITLWPYILFRGTGVYDKTGRATNALIHELCHFYQQGDYFIVGFYVVYFYHYTVNWFKYRDGRRAYRQIPFEIDARKAEWE